MSDKRELFTRWATPLLDVIQYQLELDDVIYKHTGGNSEDVFGEGRLVSNYIELVISTVFGAEAAADDYLMDMVYEVFYDAELNVISRIDIAFDTVTRLLRGEDVTT